MEMKEKVKNCAITWAEVFSYRRVWMLLGVLWTVLFHSHLVPPGFLYAFKDIGYGGVDILLLASGIGCFFSLDKNRSARDFLKRRAASILPMWGVFLVFFLLVEFAKGPMSVPQILGNVFGLGLFADIGRQFNWYIGGMWACYVLAPVMYDMVCNTTTWEKLRVVGLMFLFSFVFLGKGSLVFWSRLPIFYMGLGIAEASTKKQEISWGQLAAAVAVMAVGLGILGGFYMYGEEDPMWHYGIWWHPFILITPGMVLVISLAAKYMCVTPLRRIIAWMDALGKYTFPIYLSNVLILENIEYYYDNGLLANNPATNVLVALAIAAFAALLQGLTVLVKKLSGRR